MPSAFPATTEALGVHGHAAFVRRRLISRPTIPAQPLRIIPDAGPVSDAAFGVVFWRPTEPANTGTSSGSAPRICIPLEPGSGKRHGSELRHLLLGSHAHAVSGIMRAHSEAD